MSPWNRNIHYHDLVLRAAPAGCSRALDVGCGDGILAGRIGSRCLDVTAIDIDHATLARAVAATDSQARITFIRGDVMTHPFQEGSFDFITAVASLHHLPLIPALKRLRNLLSPHGVLAVVGLYRMHTLSDFAIGALAVPTSLALRCINCYREVAAPLRDPVETLREIRSACDAVLPGARLHRELLFRYTMIWRKP
jgi:SAM-dependent methyltransferase